jgi:hypothetical protein
LIVKRIRDRDRDGRKLGAGCLANADATRVDIMFGQCLVI